MPCSAAHSLLRRRSATGSDLVVDPRWSPAKPIPSLPLSLEDHPWSGGRSPSESEQTLRRRRGVARPAKLGPIHASFLRPDPHPDGARARRDRARVRARRRGSGVRARRVAASTTWTAAWASVCQAAWTATGLAPARVRTQQPTTSPPTSSGVLAPRWSGGQAPSATSGRVVTPTVGSPSTAPRCRARPARRGWSRSGGIDHQHLRDDRQGADGLLKQGAFPEGQ